jgi:hypothetical protein
MPVKGLRPESNRTPAPQQAEIDWVGVAVRGLATSAHTHVLVALMPFHVPNALVTSQNDMGL